MATITINEKQYPFRVAINTFIRLGKKTGLELDGISERLAGITARASGGVAMTIAEMEFFAEFILTGIEDGCRKEKQPPPEIALDDVIDLFDSGTEIEKAFSELNVSMPDAPENPQMPEGTV